MFVQCRNLTQLLALPVGRPRRGTDNTGAHWTPWLGWLNRSGDHRSEWPPLRLHRPSGDMPDQGCPVPFGWAVKICLTVKPSSCSSPLTMALMASFPRPPAEPCHWVERHPASRTSFPRGWLSFQRKLPVLGEINSEGIGKMCVACIIVMLCV